MSGQWEEYVEQAARVAYESGAPVWPWDRLTEREQATRIKRMRAALAAVGPLIEDDTRVRLVAAAARAVERDAGSQQVVGGTDPFKSLADTLAFSSNDWGSASDFAWLYGIVLGWDSDDPDEESSMPSVAATHEWSDRQVERLRALHRDFKAAAGAYQCEAKGAAS